MRSRVLVGVAQVMSPGPAISAAPVIGESEVFNRVLSEGKIRCLAGDRQVCVDVCWRNYWDL